MKTLLLISFLVLISTHPRPHPFGKEKHHQPKFFHDKFDKFTKPFPKPPKGFDKSAADIIRCFLLDDKLFEILKPFFDCIKRREWDKAVEELLNVLDVVLEHVSKCISDEKKGQKEKEDILKLLKQLWMKVPEDVRDVLIEEFFMILKKLTREGCEIVTDVFESFKWANKYCAILKSEGEPDYTMGDLFKGFRKLWKKLPHDVRRMIFKIGHRAGRQVGKNICVALSKKISFLEGKCEVFDRKHWFRPPRPFHKRPPPPPMY